MNWNLIRKTQSENLGYQYNLVMLLRLSDGFGTREAFQEFKQNAIGIWNSETGSRKETITPSKNFMLQYFVMDCMAGGHGKWPFEKQSVLFAAFEYLWTLDICALKF